MKEDEKEKEALAVKDYGGYKGPCNYGSEAREARRDPELADSPGVFKLPISILGNRVVFAVLPVPTVQQKRGSIILPDNIKDKNDGAFFDEFPFQGIVVGIGDKVENIKVGNLVYMSRPPMFQDLSKEGFIFDKRGYAIVREQDICAVIEVKVSLDKYKKIIGDINLIRDIKPDIKGNDGKALGPRI